MVVTTSLHSSKATVVDTTNKISTERIQHNLLMVVTSSMAVALILPNRANTPIHHTPLTSHRLQVRTAHILHHKVAMISNR